MAHRYNEEMGRCPPKPSARERTLYRWRTRHGMATQEDDERFQKHQGVLASIKEGMARLVGKNGGK